MTEARRLVLMRHATAESAGAGDSARALAPRGVREAGWMGTWLSGQGVRPDAALVSAARRAQQTWRGVAGSAGWQIVPQISEALYSASAETALDLIRDTDATARTFLVVGHNPTLSMLVHQLDDGTWGRGSYGFEPGTAAILEVPGDWSELAYAGCRVVALHGPTG
ncbi:MAG: histidine phosphatase family protein [Nocardioides sp.]|jgi:phosphohistidine phosphatase